MKKTTKFLILILPFYLFIFISLFVKIKFLKFSTSFFYETLKGFIGIIVLLFKI